VAIISENDKWQKREKFYSFLQVALSVFAVVYLFLTKFELKDVDWSPTILMLVETAKAQAWFTVPLLGLAVSLLSYLKKVIGPAMIWALVHHILDELHRQIFEEGVSLAEHRVTLFRYSQWCWRGWPLNAGWLLPVERSHHATRASRARFKVPDDGNTSGIAGRCWITKSVIYVSGLPNISPDVERPPKKPLTSRVRKIRIGLCEYLGKLWWLDWFWRVWWSHRKLGSADTTICSEYALHTWTSARLIAKQKRCKKKMPRSLCGIPVEVGGKPWGVIVIDSRSENLVTRDKIDEFYKRHAKMLEKLLKFA
jgi:hypothetical protein